ncbi:ester cyclase [Halomarina litorea]|uniref:ester cyclase n=1 Tax=Halomarina litorea TaxID=2961595 RepID=UPI0020C3930F|nr:ester cyclase [Halomarina sp. BCD28]
MAVSTIDQQKAHVREFNEAVFNGRDYDALDALVADDVVQHGGPGGEEVRGIGGMRAYFRMLHTAFPDLEATIEDQVAEGDLVATRYTYRGTHDGAFVGIPATHKPVTITGTVFTRIEDGKTVETWVNADVLGLMRQVGVFSPDLLGGPSA